MFKKIFKSESKSRNANRESSYMNNIVNNSYDEYAECSGNYQDFINSGYKSNVIVYRCVQMISNSLASVKIKFDCGSSKGNKSELIKNIINNPNQFQSKISFIKNIISYLLLDGNSYVIASRDINNNISSIYSLRPDRFSLIFEKNSNFIGYKYKTKHKEDTFYLDPIGNKCDVMHLKTFNPEDDWVGLSPIKTVIRSIKQHNQALLWNYHLMQNGARPSGALIVKNDFNGGRLTDEQYSQIRDQIDQLYCGTRNNGRPLILEGGIEWKEMSISPKDMDYINAKHSSARDIALAFGVPPQLLGIPGDNTYNNLREAKLSFWEETVIPLLDNLIESLNTWLDTNITGEGSCSIYYDKDSITALSLKREIIWNYIQNSDFMTEKEKRLAVGLTAEPEI